MFSVGYVVRSLAEVYFLRRESCMDFMWFLKHWQVNYYESEMNINKSWVTFKLPLIYLFDL